MNRERWLELEKSGGSLTEQEMREGWHYCPDWDELLTQVCEPGEEGECHDETHRLGSYIHEKRKQVASCLRDRPGALE